MGKLDVIRPKLPFNVEFDRGYLSVNKEGRRIIQLYSSSTQKRKTMSYARYKLSVRLGRELMKGEEADHKDNDPTNDTDDNIQLLTRQQNLDKQAEQQRVSLVVFDCLECRKTIGIKPSEYKTRSRNGQRQPYCSRSCAATVAIREGYAPSIDKILNSGIEMNKLLRIFELKSNGLSSRRIGREVGLSRRTVQYHLKKNGEVSRVPA